MSHFLAALGSLCLIVALIFGIVCQTVEVKTWSRAEQVTGTAPGPGAQGAACGFAIAGGLCLVGAAIAYRSAGRDEMQKQARMIGALEAQAANLHDEPRPS